MIKLEHEFYNRADVLTISRELSGKILITKFDGIVTMVATGNKLKFWFDIPR